MIVSRNTPDGVHNFVEHNYPAPARPFWDFDYETELAYLHTSRHFISGEGMKAGEPVKIEKFKAFRDPEQTQPHKMICCEDTSGAGYNVEVEFRWYQ
jgi:hypothetical protein